MKIKLGVWLLQMYSSTVGQLAGKLQNDTPHYHVTLFSLFITFFVSYMI